MKHATLQHWSRLTAIGLLVFLWPETAGAVQNHGPPEGYYAHQVGHLLFFLAMTGFALRIHISQLKKDPAWQHLKRGALLLCGWNCWAFAAHYLGLRIPVSCFIVNENGFHTALHMASALQWSYYILRLDHLLLIPALIFIFLGLRRMTPKRSTPTSPNHGRQPTTK